MAKVFLACLLSLPLFGYAQTSSTNNLVTVKASNKYEDPSFLRRLFMGKNYRKEWQTPVQLPVFSMKAMGYTPKELGGGMQTKSLQMVDKRGIEWVLRSVEKNVEPNLPPRLRNTFAERIVQDMISAAHPYSPLTIPPLASAIGIIVPSPTFYYIPDDPDFGEYRDIFKNSICMLELRFPSRNNRETESTADILEDLVKENDHLIIQQEVLKARLLDMLIADWDRHADQWRWGVIDSNKQQYYYAIPRDRDQAYFNSKGLLVKIARLVALKHLVGYSNNLDKLKNLNYKSWGFDAIFLNELDRGEWERAIKEIQSKLTDDLVQNAFLRMPSEIYPISGPVMVDKFKKRRNELLTAGIKYYEFLSRIVTIKGTDKKEIFKIRSDNNKLIVTVFDNKDGKEGRKLYDRSFLHSETKRIILEGFEGDDKFFISENTKSNIGIEMNGGKGNDIYEVKARLKNKITDNKIEQNNIIHRSNSRLRLK